MAYVKTIWENGTTPINETNLNKIENELETLDRNQNTSIILWEDSEGITPAGQTINLNDNIYNYRFAVIEGQWGNKLIIPILANNTYFNGGMNYPKGDGSSMVTTGLNATIINDGTDISITYFRQLEHIVNSNHDTSFTSPKLYKIIGIK